MPFGRFSLGAARGHQQSEETNDRQSDTQGDAVVVVDFSSRVRGSSSGRGDQSSSGQNQTTHIIPLEAFFCGGGVEMTARLGAWTNRLWSRMKTELSSGRKG